MNHFLRLITLTVLLLFSKPGQSQIDTDFWFAAPEISSGIGDSPIYLRFITYNTGATVTVSEPAFGGFVPIVKVIPANSVDSINLTPFLAQIESPAANVVSNNGLHITSTAPIGAFYELKATNNKEMF